MVGQNKEFYRKPIQVKLTNLDSVNDPELFNYGKIRDYCKSFNYTFEGGKAYGIIGEIGEGGWALSYILAGRCKPLEGKIEINDIASDQKILQKYSCYVGEGISINKYKFLFKRATVRDLLHQGIRQRKCPNDCIDDIVNLFGLSKERLNRTIENYSGERWRASLAVGYANGRQIYCFPWLNSNWLNKYIIGMREFASILALLKETGAIIIIPTMTDELLKGYVEDFIYFK